MTCGAKWRDVVRQKSGDRMRDNPGNGVGLWHLDCVSVTWRESAWRWIEDLGPGVETIFSMLIQQNTKYDSMVLTKLYWRLLRQVKRTRSEYCRKTVWCQLSPIGVSYARSTNKVGVLRGVNSRHRQLVDTTKTKLLRFIVICREQNWWSGFPRVLLIKTINWKQEYFQFIKWNDYTNMNNMNTFSKPYRKYRIFAKYLIIQ